MPTALESPPTVSLSEEQIDDVLYFSRANELADLQTLISELCAAHSCEDASGRRAITSAAVDLGSRNTVLHYAAANGHLEVLRWVLGSDVFGVVERAGKVYGDVNGGKGKGKAKESTTCAAVNAQNTSGNTPLHWAALNGHEDVVELLVSSAGADTEMRNNAGKTALDVAMGAEKWAVAGFLAGSRDPEKGGAGGNEDEREAGGQESPNGVVDEEDVAEGMEGVRLDDDAGAG